MLKKQSKKSLKESVLDRLEKELGEPLQPGRILMWGHPVDVEDQDPEGGLAVDPVDGDSARSLMKILRSKGFKTTFVRSSETGAGSILIEENIMTKQSKKSLKEDGYDNYNDPGSFDSGFQSLSSEDWLDEPTGKRAGLWSEYEPREPDETHEEQEEETERAGLEDFSVDIVPGEHEIEELPIDVVDMDVVEPNDELVMEPEVEMCADVFDDEGYAEEMDDEMGSDFDEENMDYDEYDDWFDDVHGDDDFGDEYEEEMPEDMEDEEMTARSSPSGRAFEGKMNLYKPMSENIDEADLPLPEMDEVDLDEVTPPGKEKLVRALKKEPGVKNPWAVAWSQHNKEHGKK